MKTLNLIGCGAVGRTLGRLFREAGLFEIQDILTRSHESARDAAAFVGAGRPVTRFAELRPADLSLIAVSDDAIASCAAALAGLGRIEGRVVCHLSGALSSAALAPLAAAGAHTASLHPVKSFADPLAALSSFAGTWCALEGDAGAAAFLGECFGALGARLFRVDPEYKSVYHAGAVLTCNYLTVLVELGLRSFERAGISRELGSQVLEPLVRGTVENVFGNGPVRALSGPVARGDAGTVARQLEALSDWDGEVATLYRLLGRVAVELAEEQGGAAPDALERVRDVLS